MDLPRLDARVFLKPAPHPNDKSTALMVRNPANGRHLASDGETVSITTYWRRRLRDGDVLVAKESRKPASGKPASDKGGP